VPASTVRLVAVARRPFLVTLLEMLRRVTTSRRRRRRLKVIAAWAGLGWHLFARGTWPLF